MSNYTFKHFQKYLQDFTPYRWFHTSFIINYRSPILILFSTKNNNPGSIIFAQNKSEVPISTI